MVKICRQYNITDTGYNIVWCRRLHNVIWGCLFCHIQVGNQFPSLVFATLHTSTSYIARKQIVSTEASLRKISLCICSFNHISNLLDIILSTTAPRTVPGHPGWATDCPEPPRTVPDQKHFCINRAAFLFLATSPTWTVYGPGWSKVNRGVAMSNKTCRINTVPLRTFPEPTRSLHGPSRLPVLKIIPDRHGWPRQF